MTHLNVTPAGQVDAYAPLPEDGAELLALPDNAGHLDDASEDTRTYAQTLHSTDLAAARLAETLGDSTPAAPGAQVYGMDTDWAARPSEFLASLQSRPLDALMADPAPRPLDGAPKAQVFGPVDFEGQSFAFNLGRSDGEAYTVHIGERQWPVMFQDSAHPGRPTIGQVARALQTLPEYARNAITDIHVDDQEDPYQDALMKTNGRGTVAIHPVPIDEPPPQGRLEKTLLHESAHILSERLWGDDLKAPAWRRWMAAMDKDGAAVSDYADTDPEEDFAETFALYHYAQEHPQGARWAEQFAHRFALMDGFVAQAKQQG